MSINFKTHANVVVIIEWAYFVFGLSCVVFLACVYFDYFRDIFNDSIADSDSKSWALISIEIATGTFLVWFLIALTLNLLLTKGVQQERPTACKAWYIITVICTIINVHHFLTASHYSTAVGAVLSLTLLCYRIYSVYTISNFIKELNTHDRPCCRVPYKTQINEKV